MAIGTISSPTTWLLGTVASPSWFQSVQDNVNGWIAGTNSLNALYIDGTGGLTVSPPSGTLHTSGLITSNGGVAVSGIVSGSSSITATFGITSSGTVTGSSLASSSAIGSSSLPNSTLLSGYTYGDMMVKAWAKFRVTIGVMAVDYSVGMSSASRTSAGVYVFNLGTAVASAANTIAVFTQQGVSGALRVFLSTTVNSTSQLTAYSVDTSGTATDVSAGAIVVYGA